MELQTIKWIIHGLHLVVAAGSFAFILIIAYTCHPGRLLLKAYEEISRNLREGRSGFLDYKKQQGFLKRCGADFHFGKWIGPINYTGIRLVLGGLGLMLGSFYQLWIGLILAVIFFWLPDVLLVWLNGKDNEQMLPELKLIYNAISMQIKAGVHITDALVECHTSVQGGRLREALYALSGDIALNADVEDALEKLQDKFDNRYIDSLCITVMQALESGQAVDLLTDIAEQMKDVEVAIMSRKKSSLDRSVTFYQLGILSAILIVVLYTCVVYMMSAAVKF